MKIDTGAFLDSLPIMGIGLLGIFIVTAVIIIGIYILKAITAKSSDSEEADDSNNTEVSKTEKKEGSSVKKESAMDLMKEREKKDFLKTDDTFNIFHDL